MAIMIELFSDRVDDLIPGMVAPYQKVNGGIRTPIINNHEQHSAQLNVQKLVKVIFEKYSEEIQQKVTSNEPINNESNRQLIETNESDLLCERNIFIIGW